MADTQRTRAAILALLADNVTGQISAQDMRDVIVTLMEDEFGNPGDFWKKPLAKNHTTDKTFAGWIDYSQVAGEALVTMDALYLVRASGVWKKACASNSLQQPCTGLACDSYASNDTDVQVLRQGLVRNTALSADWSVGKGGPVYLCSDVDGSCSITKPVTQNDHSELALLGIVEISDGGVNDGGACWRFDPDWAVVGV